VAVSLAGTVAYQATQVTQRNGGASVSVWGYATAPANHAGRMALWSNWQARPLSMAAAGLVFKNAATPGQGMDVQINLGQHRLCVWAWYFGWMLAVGLVLSALRGVSPVVAMLAAFAMMQFGLILLPQARVYPWDMPALFFATLAVAGWTRKRLLWISLALLVGMGFKESVGVFSILLLFWPETRLRTRVGLFLGGVMGCALVRYACLGALPAELIVPSAMGDMGGWVGYDNLRHLLLLNGYDKPLSQSTWLATGGLMLPFLLSFRYRDGGWWTGVALFVLLVGTAIVVEYRIFYEMIPLIVVWLLRREDSPPPPVPAGAVV